MLSHRLYLNGNPKNINQIVFAKFMNNVVFPYLKTNSIDSYLLYTKNDICHKLSQQALPAANEVVRQTYTFNIDNSLEKE